ncbi:hypothetical protein TNCV_325161 [Trichonephila clavipes]|nr:hypothetical protein TNCV_325161 [Trichonephila clavipes]
MYKKRRNTKLRSSEIYLLVKDIACAVGRGYVKTTQKKFKGFTIHSDVGVAPSDHGLANSFKYTRILLITAAAQTIHANNSFSSHTSGIVVSKADCCSVRPGFKSRRRHGFCKCIVPLRHGSTINSLQAVSPLARLVDGEERWETPDPLPRCSPSKLGWN